MSEEYINLSERFKQYRIYYPLTQSELAEKSGVSVRSISRFENGEDISLSNFIKLMRALDLGGRMADMIPDLEKEAKRSRASSARDNRDSTSFVWGDEK